ncbi:MAG TPA: aspartyl/asparaginyl beta-hydroxylase domain-containing protein [Chitinophagales bacterium]|nr:aspartyl/asparaginyl beta-hydroxylase domain-containing protein [Chitinophagales bacterium]
MNKANPLYRVKSALGKVVIAVFGWLIDLIDGRIVYGDPHAVKGTEALENNVEAIIAEYKGIVQQQKLQSVQDFFVEQEKITDADNWQSFPLFLFGREFEENTRRCPETVRLLKGIDGMCAAMFSVLKPHATIKPHRGPYKGVLRYHLGMIIPEPAGSCYILVDGKQATWAKGRGLLFDDTHVHEVHNLCNEGRVILFVDVIRPLPFPLSRINNILFDAIGRSEYVEDVLEFYSRNQPPIERAGVL